MKPSGGRTPPAAELPPGGGLLLVDKPSGCTSHDVVGRVRAVLGTRKVGHAGTLDPMATGLLVLAVERSTKLLGQLALTDKSYLATIRLGEFTTTDDAEGTVTSSADASAIRREAIVTGMRALTGGLMQVPSSVSAIKVDGRRSYQRVRAGESVELAARPVTVSRFEPMGDVRRQGRRADLDVIVDCSSGTYVRALARDLGAALGVGGHLIALRRSRVGPFQVADAVDVYGTSGVPERGAPRSKIPDALRSTVAGSIVPAAAVAPQVFEVRIATEDEARELTFGRALRAIGNAGTYAVLDPTGTRLLALVAEADGFARPRLVFEAAG